MSTYGADEETSWKMENEFDLSGTGSAQPASWIFTEPCVVTSANQNTGSALLEFPMRTAMHGKSRVSSAISCCHN